MREHHPEPQGLHEFVRTLALHRTYTEAQIASALEWALAVRCFSWEGVWHLLALLEQEVLQREANQERRRIQAAKFPVLRTLDTFDFSNVPSVKKAKILELARGEYLTKCENILFVGEIGTGKTHLATALGIAACRQG